MLFRMRWILGIALLCVAVLVALLVWERGSLERAEQRSSAESAPVQQRPRVAAAPEPVVGALVDPAIKLDPDDAVDTLAHATHWRAAVEAYAAWPEDWSPAKRARLLREAHKRAANPMARQNVTFLAVWVLPQDVATALLRKIAEGGEEADREDVVVALAFNGEPTEHEAFLALAASPSPANVRILADTLPEIQRVEGLANESARATMRSYRALGVLTRSHYFRRTDDDLDFDRAYRRSVSDEDERALLLAWLERYPGHPGSDDVALMLAFQAEWDDDHVEAARWFSRASALPDQRRTSNALRGLLGLAERTLTREQIIALRDESGFASANRQLLQYVLLRRTAASLGFGAALTETRDAAAAHPGSVIAVAWARRGVVAGPPRDTTESLDRLGNVHDLIAIERSPMDRLDPPREPFRLSVHALSRQFGLWETLADLERRASFAGQSAAADLLFKMGSIFQSEPEVLYPVYMLHTETAGEVLGIAEPFIAEGGERWVERSASCARALELFRAIEQLHPDYGAMDRVLFAQGEALRALRAYEPLNRNPDAVSLGSLRREVRAIVSVYERCAREYPESSVAAEATDHAVSWRRRYPSIFE